MKPMIHGWKTSSFLTVVGAGGDVVLVPSFGIFLPTSVQTDSVCFTATVVPDGDQEGTEATGITIAQQTPPVFDTSAPLGFSASFILTVTDDDSKSNSFCYCVYRAYIIVIYVCFFQSQTRLWKV